MFLSVDTGAKSHDDGPEPDQQRDLINEEMLRGCLLAAVLSRRRRVLARHWLARLQCLLHSSPPCFNCLRVNYSTKCETMLSDFSCTTAPSLARSGSLPLASPSPLFLLRCWPGGGGGSGGGGGLCVENTIARHEQSL